MYLITVVAVANGGGSDKMVVAVAVAVGVSAGGGETWVICCAIALGRSSKDCANHHDDEEGQDESEVGAQHAFVLLDSSTAPKERDEDN